LAQTLGSAQPGEGEEALRILKAMQAGGAGAVSPEEASFAARFAPQFVQTQQINAGQNNPLFGQLNQFAQDTTAIAGQLGEIESRLVADNAKILADWKEKQAKANEGFVTEMADTIAKLFELATERIRNETQSAATKQSIQGRT